MPEQVWGLADAIGALRRELANAMLTGEAEPLKFIPKPVELTLQAVVTKGGDGKLGWSILSIGGKLESATTHILKLQLAPVLVTPEGYEVPDFKVADMTTDATRFGPDAVEPLD